ncbi:hypothetical protein TBR22_A40840 [Luteitalea sp. TBR-22]|uniref:proton-conducting transporter transmembrane domain-containing protein n=1 Tax=Luteitalea sp. TBR-22 TaxID=2802971 RepID=UPI001AFA22D3|nr:proton-conducting transporter membrane subunit [Luteitalea sp. TBR-22]BCS34858.1 hypothetical protein TBR22_A40840 [Luteitalea sp. TBR-22]
MADPNLLLVLGSLLVPAVAALTLPTHARILRRVAVTACAVAALLAAAAAGASTVLVQGDSAVGAWLDGGRVPALGAAIYALTAMLAFLLAPARDLTRARVAALLVTVSGTVTACVAGNPVTLLVGWTVGAAPFVVGPFASGAAWRPRAALAASCLALGAGVALMLTSPGGHGIAAFARLAGTHAGGPAAFALVMLAIVLRKGIFPAHAWVADLAEQGGLPISLLVNGHLGAVVLARVLIPVFPDTVGSAFVLLSDLALFTALYAAVRAVAEPRPARILALLVLSQSACILAGLESGTAEGTTGAFVHLAVVALSTTALFGVLRAVEARGGHLDLSHHQGLAQAMPRLAVGFAIAGLALVGIPGTLGFAAEDLLVHGSLASHPQVGLLLPIATALNAVCLFRLFSRLFLGTARPAVTGLVDALPRERWALTAIIVLLVAGGVAPGLVLGWTVEPAAARAHRTSAPDAPSVRTVSLQQGRAFE